MINLNCIVETELKPFVLGLIMISVDVETVNCYCSSYDVDFVKCSSSAFL